VSPSRIWKKFVSFTFERSCSRGWTRKAGTAAWVPLEMMGWWALIFWFIFSRLLFGLHYFSLGPVEVVEETFTVHFPFKLENFHYSAFSFQEKLIYFPDLIQQISRKSSDLDSKYNTPVSIMILSFVNK
jgi:hypothetical protein